MCTCAYRKTKETAMMQIHSCVFSSLFLSLSLHSFRKNFCSLGHNCSFIWTNRAQHFSSKCSLSIRTIRFILSTCSIAYVVVGVVAVATVVAYFIFHFIHSPSFKCFHMRYPNNNFVLLLLKLQSLFMTSTINIRIKNQQNQQNKRMKMSNFLKDAAAGAVAAATIVLIPPATQKWKRNKWIVIK